MSKKNKTTAKGTLKTVLTVLGSILLALFVFIVIKAA